MVTRQGPLFTCITNHTSSALNEPTVGYNSSTRVSYQTYWYSDPVINSDSAQDFYNAYVLINNTAEINWGLNADVPEGSPDYQVNPGYQKNWPEKWNASDFARVQLATRMDTWFANPKMKLKVSGVPPSYYSVNQGTIVGVSGLMLPSVGSVWGAQCNMKPFLVMSKTFDPVKCVLSFDLLEV